MVPHRAPRSLLAPGLPSLDGRGFYRGVGRIGWEDIIPEKEYFTVTSSVDNPAVQDTRFANQRCKDAVADRIRNKTGRRPDPGPEMKGAAVFVYWKGRDCSIYLDTSGEPLARRGYRKDPLKAPMQETLAAAVVLATGWKGDGNFINPMCGCGPTTTWRRMPSAPWRWVERTGFLWAAKGAAGLRLCSLG